jgi:murein DD-endopeptidase MepM/ murein hydrolase activator NlpD
MHRQHAHPMRRPNWRRRIAVTAAAAVGVLLATAVVVWPPHPAASQPALAAGPATVPVLEPSPTRSTAPATAGPLLAAGPLAAGPQASPPPTLPATGVKAASATPVAHQVQVAENDWPEPTPAPPSSLTGYVWPIAHPRLTLPFGPTPWGGWVVGGKPFHDGIDLATFCNDRIMAAHDGVVLAAGRHFDDQMGWVGSLAAYYHRLDHDGLWSELPIVVVIDDGNGYRSIYAHFWKITVHAGEHVRAGQLIGYEGMTGHATGCHLHYGLFSPYQTATFKLDPKAARDMLLPSKEIARIDPLLVLPYRKGLGGTVQNLGG